MTDFNARRLRERVIWERHTPTPDGMGGQTRTWVEVTSLAAEIRPQGGREALVNSIPTNAQGWRVEIRWRANAPGNNDRLLWGDKVLNLRSDFADIVGDRKSLVAYAESGVAT